VGHSIDDPRRSIIESLGDFRVAKVGDKAAIAFTEYLEIALPRQLICTRCGAEVADVGDLETTGAGLVKRITGRIVRVARRGVTRSIKSSRPANPHDVSASEVALKQDLITLVPVAKWVVPEDYWFLITTRPVAEGAPTWLETYRYFSLVRTMPRWTKNAVIYSLPGVRTALLTPDEVREQYNCSRYDPDADGVFFRRKET